MQTGEQCQKCGNDFDPMHPCRCEGDFRFNDIVSAYKRGAEWMRENNDPEHLNKAANDYADYVTSHLRQSQ